MHLLVAKNTLYQIIARASSALASFFITILLASSFGILGYGDFAKITSYVGLFYLLVDLGLNAIFIQEEDIKVKFKTIFFGRLLIAGSVFTVVNLIAFILPYNQANDVGFSPFVRVGILIFSFSLFSQAILNSAAAVYQKRKAYKFYAVSIITGSIINLLGITLVTYLGFQLLYAVFSFVAAGFVTAVLAIAFSKQKFSSLSIDFSYLKKTLIKSAPISIMLILNLVYFRADTFILALLQPTKDVGTYGLSYRFFDFLITIPLFLSNSLYPFLLENKKNLRKYLEIIKQYSLIFILVGVILIFPFWFASPLFALIKPEFSTAILPFRILLLSLPFFFISSLLQWSLISLNKQRFLMYVYVFSAVLNVILNIILIPHFSYIASAAITGGCEIIVFVLLLIKLSNLRKFLETE